jgi:hypothetical protein
VYQPTSRMCASSESANVQLEFQVLTRICPRYLLADTASAKQNITWAGQTLGATFYASDGRLKNSLEVVTVSCSNGSCRVPMRAPSFALVFLSDQALNDVTATGPAAETFATTVTTGGGVFVDPSVLAMSNGDGGAQELLKAKWQATSRRSANANAAMKVGVSAALVLGFVAGALVTLAGIVRA